ncbi:MAG: urea amidolyase, partial [Alphaproteobacteria bacterium]
ADALTHFVSRPFRVSRLRDRMGIRLEPEAGPLPAEAGLRILSDAVCPGDIQIGGDGMPTVLMADHQPTGGYPRIGTVIGADLPALAQVPTGAEIALVPTDIDEAVAARARLAAELEALPRRLEPLLRDPADMPDLLSYNLIDGVTNGDTDELD